MATNDAGNATVPGYIYVTSLSADENYDTFLDSLKGKASESNFDVIYTGVPPRNYEMGDAAQPVLLAKFSAGGAAAKAFLDAHRDAIDALADADVRAFEMELELQKGTSYWVAKIYHVKDSPRMKGYLNASIEGSQKGYPTANGPSNFQIGHMNVSLGVAGAGAKKHLSKPGEEQQFFHTCADEAPIAILVGGPTPAAFEELSDTPEYKNVMLQPVFGETYTTEEAWQKRLKEFTDNVLCRDKRIITL